MPSNTKSIIAWSIYDFANTSFSALFVTFFYPYYIKEFLHGTEFQIGLVFGTSMLLVGLLVPFLGALADLTYIRKPFLVFFTLLCVIFTALVTFVNLEFALIFGFIANFSYHACLTIYNSILPSISRKKNVGSISGFGAGLGYVGTLLSLGMAYLILSRLGWESEAGIKSIFPATAIFFISFSMITFFFLKEKKKYARSSARLVVQKVFTTLKSIGTNKGVVPFLLSMFFFSDAMNTVILFLFLYGNQEIGLTVRGFIGLFVFFSMAAALGSFVSGKLSDKIGPKRTLIAAAVFWVVAVIVLLFSKTYNSFVIAGLLGGVGMGSIWTSSRPLLLALINPKYAGEFFGYLELVGKFSGFMGPIIFGFLATFFSYQYALTSLLIFFVLGLTAIQFVKVR